MTSSLVGSEMCIRDRSMIGALGLAGAKITVSTSPRSIGSTLVSTFGLIPVSYTHLTLPTICSV
eukprot:3203696-Prorocentrum_lima.AAC.1